MGGILLLVPLCVAMAAASFLAGALPISLSLSQAQLRLMSSIGIGILLGTSLIVIIPEGVETVVSSPHRGHNLDPRSPLLLRHGPLVAHRIGTAAGPFRERALGDGDVSFVGGSWDLEASDDNDGVAGRGRRGMDVRLASHEGGDGIDAPDSDIEQLTESAESGGIPTTQIGLSLILGFVLMYLIDRLPRHAADRHSTRTDNNSAAISHHISLRSLTEGAPPGGGGGGDGDGDGGDEGDSFLDSAPTPPSRRTRGWATTIGLVIHAAADGIALGASAASSDSSLGLVVFLAILIHKAPAAFGLTSVLLAQGLSKRAARGHLIVFSLASPAGALATWLLAEVAFRGQKPEDDAGHRWTGMLLLFSAGTFLYVAMHTMQEGGGISDHAHAPNRVSELDDDGSIEGGLAGQRRRRYGPQLGDTLATVGGMLLPLLTQMGHSH